MKKPLLCFSLYALIVYLTSPTLNRAVAATQPSAGDGTHFCSGVVDWPPQFHRDSQQPDNRRHTQTFAANLNLGEPYVRLIYFLPSDRALHQKSTQR